MRIRLTLAFLAAFAAVTCSAQVLFYGGDPEGSLINNTVETDGSIALHVLDDFVVPAGAHWHLTALFSNDLTDHPLPQFPVTQAQWSIRTGVSSSSFGTVVYSGTSPVTMTPTGRTFGPDVEYTVLVSGLSLELDPGIYFVTVSPIADAPVYYVAESNGLNGVGLPGPAGVFQETIQASPPVHTIGESSGPRRASLGVMGTATAIAIPALSGLGYALLAIAIAMLGALASRASQMV